MSVQRSDLKLQIWAVPPAPAADGAKALTKRQSSGSSAAASATGVVAFGHLISGWAGELFAALQENDASAGDARAWSQNER